MKRRNFLGALGQGIVAATVGGGILSGCGVDDEDGNQPPPPLSSLPDAVTPQCAPSGTLPGALLTCRNLITFAPPRPFNPDAGVFPNEAELRTALMSLQAEGWRGLVTYSLDGTLQAVPRLAKDAGFTM